MKTTIVDIFKELTAIVESFRAGTTTAEEANIALILLSERAHNNGLPFNININVQQLIDSGISPNPEYYEESDTDTFEPEIESSESYE